MPVELPRLITSPFELSRRTFVLSAAAGALAALAGNAYVVGTRTRSAAPRDGGHLLRAGALEVNVRSRGSGPPLVLIHGFGAAIDWWDRIAPALSARRRVAAIDLIGHGGSEAPLEGYAIEDQAMVVSAVLDGLGITGADIVAHSMGGEVATALVERRPDVVGRIVLIGTPSSADVTFDVLTRLSLMPVLGESLARLRTRRVVRRGLSQAFAPGFEVPESFVDDLLQLTDRAYRGAHAASTSFRNERPVDERLSALPRVPRLLVLFGGEDAIVPPSEASRYHRVPGAEVVVLAGVGHSPMVETPGLTLDRVVGFLDGPA